MRTRMKKEMMHLAKDGDSSPRKVEFSFFKSRTLLSRLSTICSMKMRPLFSLLLAAWLPPAMIVHAQDFAPEALAGSFLTVAVGNGRAPFAASGSYRLFTSVAGTDYVMLGAPGPLGAGAYSYAKTGPASAGAVLTETGSGSAVSLQLSFASPTNGTLALTNAAGFQTGAFTIIYYAQVSPPELFLPSLAGGQFQGYLGGHEGFLYAIDTSSDLAHWLPWQNALAPDLTAGFASATGGGASFFRARLSATAFAPATLTNKNLNVTVAAGAAPLASNGIFQWLADPSGTGYQLLGGPGITSGSGTYTYTLTGANSGLLACVDSSTGGHFSSQFVFTSPAAGFFYLTNGSAGFESGPFVMSDGAVEFLGNVQFTPDAGRARSLVVDASSNSVTLSVTNAAGWVWTLVFPGDAVTGPEEITMTPFAGVNGSQCLLPITNGISLGPDGLQFCDGVTLTVTPPGALGPHAALLLAEADGSGLQFVATANEAGSLSTTLFHFTSVSVTDPSAAQWSAFAAAQLSKAEAAYAQATNDIQALLKNATNQPPPPPDYVWSCANTNAPAEAAINDYIRTLFAKESAAISRLVSAASELTGFGQSYATNSTNLVKHLLETDEFAQVNTLFARYYTSNVSNSNLTVFVNGDSYKMVALYRLSSSVNAQDKSFGGKGDTNWLALIKSWSKGIRDGCVRQVHDDHLYALGPVALNVESFRNTVLNVPPDVTGGFKTKLAKAFTFELTLDMNFAFADWDSEGTLDDQVTEEAQGDVTDLAAALTPPAQYVTNKLNCVSGTWAELMSDCSYTLDSGQISTFYLGLVLETCQPAPQAFIGMTGPDLPIETWTGCNEVSLPTPWIGVIYGTAFVCQTTGANGSGGLFTFPLANGQAEAVNQTVEGDSSTGNCADPLQHATGTIQFHLLHTPK